MHKLVYGLAVSFVLTGFTAWAGNTAPATTPAAGAPAAVATPKPMPPDVKAARKKWLNAHAQEVQARHDLEMTKLKHSMANNKKCLADAQAKNEADKVTRYQAKAAALDKIKDDQDQILALKQDQIKDLKVDDKTDSTADSDQIKALQDDIKAQWQSTK